MSDLPDAPQVVMTPLPPRPKVRTPDTFNGTRAELKKFLLQCDLYLELREKDFDNETDKVYFAMALLRGPASDWAEPFARERLDKTPAQWSAEVNTMFGDFDAFKQAITNMFGDPSEDRRAAGELLLLRQTGSVVNYAAKFQQLQAKTGWDERASADQFYRGLQDKIKDQMALGGTDRPTTLVRMIRVAQDIGDRLHERAMEKKEGNLAPRWTYMKKKDPPQQKNSWPQPMDLSVVQTRPRNQGHPRGRGGKKKNTPNRSTNDKPTGKCFNCGRQGHWAKECRQPKRERNAPVQVNVLETVERKLLPIPETEEHIPKTMIQECVKTMKAEHRELESAEIPQVIQNRIFALEGWFDLKVHQRAAVIGITNNLFVMHPDDLIERLLLQLDRDIPRGVALNLRALKILLEEGYFNPEIMPERDTHAARMRLARAITQDLLDKQEPESAETTDTDSTSSTSSDGSDWGVLAELPMPPRGHRDYVSWIRVRLADVDLHCTRMEAEQWIETRNVGQRIDWSFKRGSEPSIKEFVQDILARQHGTLQWSTVQWILKSREKRIEDLKDWQGQAGITEELVPPSCQIPRVTSWESDLLNRAEVARWLLEGRDPDINVRIHETKHWSLCTDNECLIHVMKKHEYSFFPKPGVTPDRTGESRIGNPRVWNSDFPTRMLLNGGILEATLTKEHRNSQWRKCWYGTCQIHQEAKRTAGYWPKCPAEADPAEVLEILKHERSDSGNE
jgi:CxxC motif-containing protein